MRVEDAMTCDVISVGPEDTIERAARLMADHGVSGLPVVDPQGRLVGIVSEGDLIVRQTPRRRLPWWRAFFADGERLARDYQKRVGVAVRDVMTPRVISVKPGLSIELAAAVLETHRIRRVPVVAEEGGVVGILSRGDLVKVLAATSRAGVPLSDAQLAAEMRTRMAQEAWVPPVVVDASGGVLTIWGLADRDAERQALETMARAIPGCKGVKNQVTLKSETMAYAYGGI